MLVDTIFLQINIWMIKSTMNHCQKSRKLAKLKQVFTLSQIKYYQQQCKIEWNWWIWYVMIWAALIFSWKTFFIVGWILKIAATPLHSLDRCPNKHSALPIGKVAASNWKGPLQNEKNRLLSTRTIPEKRHIRMKSVLFQQAASLWRPKANVDS